MPMPHWVAWLNKRTFNRWELKRGSRPVLTHIGRQSGTEYRTPIEAIAVDGGYVIVIVYGADRTDWVRNVLAAGSATLQIDGDDHRVVSPRILDRETVSPLMPASFAHPPAFFKIDEYLHVETADDAADDAAEGG